MNASRLPHVLARYKISRAKWYQLVASGAAPQPLKFGRASIWTEEQLLEFDERVKRGELA
jgi:predicted DNA-binding transcriptional regulator AlpA